MNWVDNALNTPLKVIGDLSEEKMEKIVCIYTDPDGGIWYRVSSMSVIEAIGFLEAGKSLLMEALWSEGEEEDALQE